VQLAPSDHQAGHWYQPRCRPCVCASSFLPETNCRISSHQYNHTFLAQGIPTVQMFWTLSSNGLRIDVVRPLNPPGNNALWSGIGFCTSSIGSMINADAVIFPYSTAPYSLSAYFLTDHNYGGLSTPKLAIRNTTNFILPGYNIYGFTRDLASGNNIIDTNTYQVYMVAVASTKESWPTGSPAAKHELTQMGADTMNLLTGTMLPPLFYWTDFVTHGFLMWICWCIIIPAGFLWARFIKGSIYDKDARWFEGHRSMMSAAFIILIISAVYAIAQSSTHMDSTHKIMGISVVTGALYQVMSAVMRPHADPKSPTIQRLLFEYTHHSIGRISILVAWVTIGYGLDLIPGMPGAVLYVHSVFCGAWFSFWIILEIRKLMSKKNNEYDRLPHK